MLSPEMESETVDNGIGNNAISSGNPELLYKVQVHRRDYSLITLTPLNSDKFPDKTLSLQNSQIKLDYDCIDTHIFHDDICTYNGKTLKVTETNIYSTNIVGSIKIDLKRCHGYNCKKHPKVLFTASSQHYPSCLVSLNPHKLKMKHNQKYFVIIRYNQNQTKSKIPITGYIKHIIGEAGNENVECMKVLYQHNILPMKRQNTRSDTGISYNTTIYDITTPQELEHYQNETYTPCVTIDPKNALDMDDALSYQVKKKTPNLTLHRIGIHITHLEFWVHKLKLQEYFTKQYFTIYCKWKNINIFPNELSHHLFSLKARQDRLALSCFVDILEVDGTFTCTHHFFQHSIIRVLSNLSYETANELTQKPNKKPKNISRKKRLLYSVIPGLFHVSKHILPETSIVVSDATQMVQKYMVLFNKLAAEFLVKHQAAFVVRRHTLNYPALLPKDPKLKQILTFRASPGMYSMYDESKKMAHDGLGLSVYAHFTSPIRRVCDLYNQWPLSKILHNQPESQHICLTIQKLQEAEVKHKCIQRQLDYVKHKYNTLELQKPYSTFIVDWNIQAQSIMLYFEHIDLIYKYYPKQYTLNSSQSTNLTCEHKYQPFSVKYKLFENIFCEFNLIQDNLVISFDVHRDLQ